MRACSTVLLFVSAITLALAEEPDGLILPPGFHASVVAEDLGAVRHLTVRENGDIYVSTAVDKQNSGSGIIALHLDPSHHSAQVEHFGSVAGGTGIRFYKGALYAASASAIYRFRFSGSDALVPGKDPDIIVDGLPAAHPGFNRANIALAFDAKGNMFVALEASANLCTAPDTPEGAPPVGLKPCPDLGTRAGVWRFSANKIGQKFPTDGEQLATGIRDISSLDWSPTDGHLYGIMHGRDNTHRFWPNTISAEDDDNIADEMHRITKGTDFGWPYTYYDGARKMRLISPEYGGDGKTQAQAGVYSTPVLTFQSPRAAPVDLVFYSGSNFPASYRGGAFVVLHGTRNKNGYDLVFVPFNKNGVAGPPTVFVDGFAAFDPSSKTPGRARYRPVGAAIGPDGTLYVLDSQKGRLWRIAYGGDSVLTARGK
ncbi:MAG TPA: PQQ-dependent sugar dehydrogenase [Bryobacteraceae bacterium]|nr:PQQ-dependent sugar dehydrogenase [Bryobacteraceae bacterium]